MTNNLWNYSTFSVLNHWTSYWNNKHQNFSFEIQTRIAQYEKSFIFYFVLLFSYSDFVLGIHINTSPNEKLILAISILRLWLICIPADNYSTLYWAQSTAVSVKPSLKVDLEIKIEVKIILEAEFKPEMRWVSCPVMIRVRRARVPLVCQALKFAHIFYN